MSSTSKTLESALAEAQARFKARNTRSAELHAEASSWLPGGNTRTTLHTTPFPVYMSSGKDHTVTSEDGHTYTDLVGELSAGLYGHSNPVILSAMQKVLSSVGLNLGAQTVHETEMAKAICERFDLERVRFTNSGTEATLHALAAARRFTGKRKVVVFGGGYHGSAFMFGGGKRADNNVDMADWIVVTYNDLIMARKRIHMDGVAACLVEGVQGSGGGIRGSEQFLAGVQEACRDAGVLFILDEVMTSRLAPGGFASTIKDLKPDLKTFGKWLGGGLAFGAFGGRQDVMAAFDPSQPGSLTHGGTFNNNTLAMYVGHAGLTQIYTPEVCVEFNNRGDELRKCLEAVTKGTKMCFTGKGSLLASHFTEKGLQTLESQEDEVEELKDLFWYEMMEEKFWSVRRGNVSLVLG